jgi:subtilisin family serine protease
MPGVVQFDPGLKQLLLRKTGSPLGESASEDVASEELPVVAKLADPSVAVPGLRVTASFGPVVTGRVPVGEVLDVRGHPNVLSLKPSAQHRPDLEPPAAEATGPAALPAPPVAGRTGQGVTVAVIGWGCDFAHRNFRHADGRTRLESIWDQRGGHHPTSPEPFGYGRDLTREQIDAALGMEDPYAALGYDPADADPFGNGAHDTHVLDIAAGNGSAPGAAPGVAREADLMFVHLRGDDTGPHETLADSARLLEAIRYVVDRTGDRPVVINCSLGATGGPHDASPLAVQALDALLAERPGCAITLSCGNYYEAGLHRSGRIGTGEQVDLAWRVMPSNDETAEMEIWYPGADTLSVDVIDPAGRVVASAALGEDQVARDGDRITVSLFHRRFDSGNGDNQVDLFLWPDAVLGDWVTRLRGDAVVDGRWHAWIERDDPAFQSRFAGDADPTSTTGTIANGHRTISVGAYDARQPGLPMAPFSSAGPSRDERLKPDVAARGVAEWAARSSRPGPGYRLTDGLTVKSGTSMAAPRVAGVIALMFEEAAPERLPADEVKELLTASARTPPSAGEADRLRYGAGAVDAAAAVEAVRRRRAGTRDGAAEPGGREAAAPAAAPEAVAGLPEDRLRARLARTLPLLLVEYGDRELRRRDGGGPVYHQRQPLVFAPTGRRYTLGPGTRTYHAANFVLNSAYRLGYDVPVHPRTSPSARQGRAYHPLRESFEALASGTGNLAAYLRRFFEVVATPGQEGVPEIHVGDILLGDSEPGLPVGHASIVVDPVLRPMTDPAFRRRDTSAGRGVACIGAGLVPHPRTERLSRGLVDDLDRVLDDRMLLRLKPTAIDLDRVPERLRSDDDRAGGA